MSGWKIKHHACEHCGSSDAASMNHDDWWTCFSCGERWPDGGTTYVPEQQEKGVVLMQISGAYKSYERLPADVCSKFGIRTSGGDIYFEYRDENGNICAQKKRLGGNKEQTFTEGQWSEGKLFGQHLWDTGGRYLIITEGEKDAASVYAMNNKAKVVSIRNGAKAALKDCKREYKWLDSFENIVICFDMDEAGRAAAREVAGLFPSKAKIMRMPDDCKDAHDAFTMGKATEFNKLFWEASEYLPEGIVNAADLWEELNAPVQKPLLMYPWDGLNTITHGIREGELVVFSAGSGVGKSQTMREILYHVLTTTDYNIGGLFFEESNRKTAQSIMSLDLNKPLHLPQTQSTPEERKKAFDNTVGRKRLFLNDKFGSSEIEYVMGQVRYLAKAKDCKFIFLDHISIIVSAQQNGDERKAIDEVMTKLRTLVQEENIAMLAVCHLKRPEGKAHEEGGQTSLAQLRGSASIAQLSDIVLGCERNGQAETEEQRNTTLVRVLKNRFSGETGPACKLYYDKNTNRMTEVLIDEDVL